MGDVCTHRYDTKHIVHIQYIVHVHTLRIHTVYLHTPTSVTQYAR